LELLPNGNNIKRTHLYEQIADDLEEQILSDAGLIGTKLSSEQAIADSYGVSRNVVREAIKIVKERGLLTVKEGEGAFIVKPNSDVLTNMLGRAIVMNEADISDIYEIRNAIETKACALAAVRIREEDTVKLGQILKDLNENQENVTKWSELDIKFHTAIAKATYNPLFYAFIKPLASTLYSIFEKSFYVPGAKSHGLMVHERILSALVSHNSKQAEEQMRIHLIKSQEDITRGLQ